MLVRIAGTIYQSSTLTLFLSVFEGLNAIHKTPCVKIKFMTLVAEVLSIHSDNSHSKLRRDKACLSCNPRLVLPVLYTPCTFILLSQLSNALRQKSELGYILLRQSAQFRIFTGHLSKHVKYFYCCTVHSDIRTVHSPTNAFLLI